MANSQAMDVTPSAVRQSTRVEAGTGVNQNLFQPLSRAEASRAMLMVRVYPPALPVNGGSKVFV